MTRKPYKYDRQTLAVAVENNWSISGVMRALGARGGGSHRHIRDLIYHYGLDTSHFSQTKSREGIGYLNRKDSWEKVLVLGQDGEPRQKAYRLRSALIESGRDYRCAKCENGGEWRGDTLRLDVDHINRKYFDNRPENLRFLCPNCHRVVTLRIL